MIVQFPGALTAQLSKVGGKGQSLIRMAQIGLPVPPGFVLTVDFFQSWLDELKLADEWSAFLKARKETLETKCNALKKRADGLKFSKEQSKSLDDFLNEFDKDAVFAVRSSSPEEDLEGFSFAGGYETILGATRKDILKAIKKAFASCLDYRVQAYKLQHGFDIFDPRIAVVIQQQIASDVSGVVFSINPLTNSYDEVVFNANWGLGETVVAGLCTPDTVVVNKSTMQVKSREVGAKETRIVLKESGGTESVDGENGDDMSLSDGHALSLTRYVKTLEEIFRKPVDVEWAIANSNEYILQARPITSYVPMPPSLVTPPGSPRRLYLDVTLSVQGLQKPMSVMGISYLCELGGKAGKKVYGVDMIKNPDFTIVRIGAGRIYMLISQMVRLFGKDKVTSFMNMVDPLSARAVNDLDMSIYEPMNPKMLLAPFFIFRGLGRYLPGMIDARMFPEKAHLKTQELVQEYMIEVDKVKESRDSLSVFTDKLIKALLKVITRGSLPCFGASRYALTRLKKAAQVAGNGIDEEQLRRLELAIPNNITTEMGLELYALAAKLPLESTDLTYKQFVEQSEQGEFTTSWKTFLKKYGHRGPEELDIAAPRYRDDPSILFEQVKMLRKSSHEKDNPMKRFEESERLREQTYEKICSILAEKDKKKLRRFQSNYRTWVILGGYREMHKYCAIYAIDAYRGRLLEEAEKLVKKGRLDETDQIFDLTLEDLSKHGKKGKVDLIELGQKNRVDSDRLARVPSLPALIDSRGEIIRPAVTTLEDGSVAGSPMSTGVVRGRVKVLNRPDEKPLEYGEILVARATDPGWTPLFINAAGLILEVGGLLQHGALVAREYGLPCVGGITGATSLWEDGTMVEVDGSNGIVRTIEEE